MITKAKLNEILQVIEKTYYETADDDLLKVAVFTAETLKTNKK